SREAPGGLPHGDRAVRPRRTHRGTGGAATRLANRDGAHAADAGPGATAGPTDAPRTGALDRIDGFTRSFSVRHGSARRAEGFHESSGGAVRDPREGPGGRVLPD